MEHPILCTYRKNEKPSQSRLLEKFENKKIIDTQILTSTDIPRTNCTTTASKCQKQKLTNDDKISLAENLHTVPVSEAKSNLDDKMIITKIMFDRVYKNTTN